VRGSRARKMLEYGQQTLAVREPSAFELIA
jgi:hypothetical protein